MIEALLSPPPGWSAERFRIKSELDYGRGPKTTQIYCALFDVRRREATMTAVCRGSPGH